MYIYLLQLKLFFIHTAEIWSITIWDKESDGSFGNSCSVGTLPYLCYVTTRFQKPQKTTHIHAQWFTSHSTKNTTKHTHQHYFTIAHSSGQTCPAKKAHTYHYQHTHQLLEHSVVQANITQLVDHTCTVHMIHMQAQQKQNCSFNKDFCHVRHTPV